jgi:hypothetical protein
MLDCAESFYDGTWSSGPLPEEVEDFELMAEFGWTWQELQATPFYVRRFTTDLLSVKREARAAAAKKAQARQPRL